MEHCLYRSIINCSIIRQLPIDKITSEFQHFCYWKYLNHCELSLLVPYLLREECLVRYKQLFLTALATYHPTFDWYQFLYGCADMYRLAIIFGGSTTD